MNILDHNLVKKFLIGLFLLQIFSIPAHAETDDKDAWRFQVAPYAWLAGQKGTVATLPCLPPADIDVDFWDDVLGNINGALFLVGEARKGRYGITMDVAYNNIEFEEATPGPYFSSITSTTKSWIVSAAGFYRLVEKDSAFLDAVGGARYWSVDSDLSLNEGLISGQSISNEKNWVDPIIGVKGLMPIGASKFFVSGFFLVGGFGAGSDSLWDANANIGYQWTRTFSTILGYRYLSVDYEKDEFLYDIDQQGPILGLSWRF